MEFDRRRRSAIMNRISHCRDRGSERTEGRRSSEEQRRSTRGAREVQEEDGARVGFKKKVVVFFLQLLRN